MTSTKNTSGKANIGLVGLGVMGRNLALNLEQNGFEVALWNRSHDKVKSVIEDNPGKKLLGGGSIEEFMALIKKPRAVLLMVKAGGAVDEIIESLTPFMDDGDILIDGGNSWFMDSRRRAKALSDRGLRFIGLGVSGGEEGARNGPSLMPGGSKDAYDEVAPMLEAIAAKTQSGPCVTHVGKDGAGHFVKMVHNGIEYADMQLIAEAYHLLRDVEKMSPAALAQTFKRWNNGPLESFLIDITSRIFSVKDGQSEKALVDLVLDKAGQKGTGRWTVETAAELGVPVPAITAAVDARVMSSMKDQRVAASVLIGTPTGFFLSLEETDFYKQVHDALLASKICAYAQGLSLISAASQAYEWHIDLKEIARIWKGGCIIRAKLLDTIMNAYDEQPEMQNLMTTNVFSKQLAQISKSWRKTVSVAASAGVPIPAMGACLSYYDGYRCEKLPHNLIQAQRDAFGAHTYQRVDRLEDGFVHTDWLSGKRG